MLNTFASFVVEVALVPVPVLVPVPIEVALPVRVAVPELEPVADAVRETLVEVAVEPEPELSCALTTALLFG